MAKKKQAELPYTATIRVLGQSHTAQGNSTTDAITNLKVPNARGVGVLSVKKGDAHRERILTPVVVSRLFSLSPTMRQMALKNTALLFDL